MMQRAKSATYYQVLLLLLLLLLTIQASAFGLRACRGLGASRLNHIVRLVCPPSSWDSGGLNNNRIRCWSIPYHNYIIRNPPQIIVRVFISAPILGVCTLHFPGTFPRKRALKRESLKGSTFRVCKPVV